MKVHVASMAGMMAHGVSLTCMKVQGIIMASMKAKVVSMTCIKAHGVRVACVKVLRANAEGVYLLTCCS